jgi:ABC-type microcin C transport system permease subunit YejE
LLSSVVQPGFWWLLAITVLFGWMALVGVVRAEFAPVTTTIFARRRRWGQRPAYHPAAYAA